MFKVTGRQTVGRQAIPVAHVARKLRTGRACAAGYGYGEFVASGWTMTVVSTADSRERYRLAMVADHCDGEW